MREENVIKIPDLTTNSHVAQETTKSVGLLNIGST